MFLLGSLSPSYYRLLRFLQSMELALVLMVFLAIFSILGTFIPQQEVATQSQLQRFAGEFYPLLDGLGLFNVFTAPWFFALLVALFLSLLFGSWRWLRPAVKQVFNASPMSLAHAKCHSQAIRLIQPQDRATTQRALTSALLIEALQRQQWRVVFFPERQCLYADKGRWHRLGSSVVHVGLLLLMLAGTYGAFYGFTAQQVTTPGQSFPVAEASLFKPNLSLEQGWQGVVPPYRLMVDAFDIDYYATQPTKPKQFTTTLRLFDEATKTLVKGTVSVNHPFTYGQLTVYQATYSLTDSFRIVVDKREQTLTATLPMLGRRVSILSLPQGESYWLIPFTRLGDGVHEDQLHVLPFKAQVKAQSKTQSAQTKAPLILTESHPLGQIQTRSGTKNVRFLGPVVATGLQLKQSPEVPWLYLSFVLVVLGALWSIPPHWRLWACYDSQQQCWYVVPKAHKQSKRLRQYLATLGGHLRENGLGTTLKESEGTL
jgi:cytochrome c biogenesis protein